MWDEQRVDEKAATKVLSMAGLSVDELVVSRAGQLACVLAVLLVDSRAVETAVPRVVEKVAQLDVGLAVAMVAS